MICNNCGYERPDDMPVCPNCGPGSKAFAADEPEAQQSGAAAETPVPEPAQQTAEPAPEPAQQTAEPARQTVPELRPFLDTDPVPGRRRSKKKTGSG